MEVPNCRAHYDVLMPKGLTEMATFYHNGWTTQNRPIRAADKKKKDFRQQKAALW